jgi:arylformamidase
MPRATPEWLTAEYDNRARVAGWQQHLQRWAQASELARAKLSRRLDVAFGPAPTDRLDIFPSPRANAPVLVFLHGGYWRALDKRDVSYVAPAFVDAGAMVVVPNYALAPAVTVDAIALQCARAVAWTVRHAALYGGNPSHVVVAGHSAGGHLAAMMAGCDWKAVDRKLPAKAIQAAVSISGLHELDSIRRTPFLQADLKLTPASAKRLSPALWRAPRGVQVAAWVGGAESSEFHRQNRLLREAWGAKVVTSCDEVPGADHFTVVQDFVDAGKPLHRTTLGLLGLA